MVAIYARCLKRFKSIPTQFGIQLPPILDLILRLVPLNEYMAIQVAIAGATGYAGAELVRLLSLHPSAEIVAVTSSRHHGIRLDQICPWIDSTLTLQHFSQSIEADVIFLCQETGFASEVAPILEPRMKVIDLSADFRLDQATYERVYHREWGAAKLATTPIYGLPELCDRQSIASAQVIANPGCYPTVSLLGLLPLLRSGQTTGTPVIDAKSGVSGAGRSRQETDYLFTELSDGFKAYGTVGHRHQSEIEQMTGCHVRFTPHLLPVARGIEASIYVPISQELTSQELTLLYQETYADEPFVRIVPEPPSTKQVRGANRCDIFVTIDEQEPRFAVISAVIDNLVKGAAGQAIQNMNLLFDFPESTGLPRTGLWP